MERSAIFHIWPKECGRAKYGAPKFPPIFMPVGGPQAHGHCVKKSSWVRKMWETAELSISYLTQVSRGSRTATRPNRAYALVAGRGTGRNDGIYLLQFKNGTWTDVLGW